jgi:ribosomal protein S12 methylthiotransferase
VAEDRFACPVLRRFRRHHQYMTETTLSIPIQPSPQPVGASRPGAPWPGTPNRTVSGRVALVTLGCPKNLVDSEAMLGLLGRAGFATTGDLEEADVAVVNTCSFIEPARQESVEAILEVAAHKGRGRLRALVVAGCLAQRYGAELVREIPEVDAVVGTGELGRIAMVVEQLLKGEPGGVHVGSPGAPVTDFAARVLATPPHYAYLKISEGCDHRCAFCIIPQLRGPLRSRSVEANLEDARRLAAAGVRELNLISQDTTGYGADLPGGRRELLRLLAGLNDIQGIAWIPLLYTHPALWKTPLMDAVRELEHVVPYVDIPIQHVSDRMLKRMNRGLSGSRQRQVLNELRERIPGLAVRTTVIVGHPGEEETDLQEVIDFVHEYRFERLGVFPYSPEEGTPAGEDMERVDPVRVRERLLRVEAAARQVALELHASRVGAEIPVMVDGAPTNGRTPARSTWDAPEIDGRVWIEGEVGPLGTVMAVQVTGAGARDLTAIPCRRGA